MGVFQFVLRKKKSNPLITLERYAELAFALTFVVIAPLALSALMVGVLARPLSSPVAVLERERIFQVRAHGHVEWEWQGTLDQYGLIVRSLGSGYAADDFAGGIDERYVHCV